MGNALDFECPNCGATREQKVVRTDPLHWYNGDIEKRFVRSAKYRLRERRCQECQQSFDTVEIPKDFFDHLIWMFERAYRARESAAEARSEATQMLQLVDQCMPVVSLYELVFVDKIDPRLVSRLPPERLQEIVRSGQVAVNALPGPERRVVVEFFGISAPRSDQLEDMDAAPGSLPKAIRMLKHPSRSRSMRKAFSELVRPVEAA